MMTLEQFRAFMNELEGSTKTAEVVNFGERDDDPITDYLKGRFSHKDGIASQAKKELSRFFDTSSGRYATRQQSLREKISSVLDPQR